MQLPPGFQKFDLDNSHALFSGTLPDHLRPDFQSLWDLHPAEFQEILVHGRRVRTPRWQQAYGKDYRFSGQVNAALEAPPLLEPLLDWSRTEIFRGMNGILVNWYDGSRAHYIGKHRDSVAGLVEGAPILTASFGGERTFRMRPYRQAGRRDFRASQGQVFIIPYNTNRAWTHEVPAGRHRDRRISVTVRAFQEAGRVQTAKN